MLTPISWSLILILLKDDLEMEPESPDKIVIHMDNDTGEIISQVEEVEECDGDMTNLLQKIHTIRSIDGSYRTIKTVEKLKNGDTLLTVISPIRVISRCGQCQDPKDRGDAEYPGGGGCGGHCSDQLRSSSYNVWIPQAVSGILDSE